METNRRKIKILYLTYGPQSGVVSRLIDNLSPKGVVFRVEDVTKILSISSIRARQYPNFLYLFASLAQSIRFFKNKWLYLYMRTPFAFKQMTLYAEKLIHIYKDADAIYQSGVLFSPSFKKPGKPFFLGIIDDTYRLGRRFLPSQYEEYEARVYSFASEIFVMSQVVRRSLIDDYNIPETKIEVTGVGPNVTPQLLPNIKDFPRRKTHRIVFIGKGFEGKGGLILLEAFQLVKKEIPDASLCIIGDTISVNDTNIEIKGIVSEEEVAKELEKASLFVLPTLKEAFGIAFLDAMSFGLPCIGTNIRAIPEIIDDGKTGYLVPPGDSNTLAMKMIELLKDKRKAEGMGKEGQKKVLDQFNWEKISRGIYESIVSQLKC